MDPYTAGTIAGIYVTIEGAKFLLNMKAQTATPVAPTNGNAAKIQLAHQEARDTMRKLEEERHKAQMRLLEGIESSISDVHDELGKLRDVNQISAQKYIHCMTTGFANLSSDIRDLTALLKTRKCLQ